ncbi:MAG: hypothetical protein H7829_08555 [Magnetococcus sp. THC-1_WYH]
MRLDKAQFLKRLVSFPKGQIIACNLLSGYDIKIIDATFIHDLIDWWRALVIWNIKRNHDSGISDAALADLIEKSFLQVIFNSQAPGFRPGHTKPNFLLAGKRRKLGRSRVDRFVNITDVEPFVKHVLCEQDRRNLTGKRGIKLGVVSRREERIFMKSGQQTIQPKTQSTIGNPERLLWVAPDHNQGNSLSALFSSKDAAERCRDLLGLNHYQDGTGLIAMFLPLDVVKKLTHARPTVVDSGGYKRFKSIPDSPSSLRRSSWGFTVDLESLLNGATILDGWPERVVEPIPVSQLGPLTFVPLGFLKKTRGETSKQDDDKTFAGRVCLKHGADAALLNRLLSL